MSKSEKKFHSRELQLALVSTLITLILGVLFLEIAYRGYLHVQLPSQVPDAFEVTDTPTLSVYAPPGRWTYNRDYGFDYVADGHITANIVDGLFSKCTIGDGINARKNVESRPSNFDSAPIRGALVGSSYTMVADADGRMFHEALSDMMSEKVGKDVGVENYSRDSFGFIQMMDLAARVAETEKPDFLIIAFNTAAISMARHWRTVEPFERGFHNFYFLFSEDRDNITTDNALLHRFVVYDKVTEEWCNEMMDAVVLSAIGRHKEILSARAKPQITVDLLSLRTSFLYNRIVHKNAFWEMDVYKHRRNSKRPIRIHEYDTDTKFIDSATRIRATGVPFMIVHIPSFPELKSGVPWSATGFAGIPQSQEMSLINSIERASGYKVHNLLPLVGAPRDDAADFAKRATGDNFDWHPNQDGVILFGDALARLAIDQFSLNNTSN